ncbi:PepSY domain-containing protein [Methanobacterium spitsbergense]|uniref:PepSY domain-containing protein n=1 Tax=Methanobacterium spitsbergense TaxID=2874285 RepID=A0A8T5V122_9EURY|nr:PepSY domain-containing protein [Methanobacterium spitsbergense]MBZ2165395.1 PepSY domain-containing protein [Methanobacterium spitsbergense]
MDLKEGWEKKALLGVGIIIFIIIGYAYFAPFTGTPTSNITQNQTTPAQMVPVPYAMPSSNNSTSNNNSTTNGTYIITAEQAKTIAINANQGFSAGSVTQGNVKINETSFPVWVVTITNKAISKTVFVDAKSGNILQPT